MPITNIPFNYYSGQLDLIKRNSGQFHIIKYLKQEQKSFIKKL